MQLTDSVVMGASLTNWLEGMIADAQALITAVLIVVGIVVAILIIVKNPTVGRVITGVCVGAFIAGLPWIIPAVGEMFKGDIKASSHELVVDELPQAFFGLETKEATEL